MKKPSIRWNIHEITQNFTLNFLKIFQSIFKITVF